MIIATIEKIDANTGKRETLHELIITNDGTGSARVGNYNVRLQTRAKEDRIGRVEQHHRINGVLRLLHDALEAESFDGLAVFR